MTAFRATYSDWKLVKTRGVVQVVMEVPLAESDAAYEVLGGMPVHGKERWFGIAAIDLSQAAKESKVSAPVATLQPENPKPSAGVKRDWRDMSPQTQAGIRCSEAIFAAYLREQRPDDWRESREDASECVRLICGVVSRAQLGTDQRARVIWHQLDTAYAAWKALEHA